jgi:hypothetical protein
MYIGVVINGIIGLIGLLTIFGLLVVALVRKDKKKLRQAGLIFVGTLTILTIASVIEFLIVVIIT